MAEEDEGKGAAGEGAEDISKIEAEIKKSESELRTKIEAEIREKIEGENKVKADAEAATAKEAADKASAEEKSNALEAKLEAIQSELEEVKNKRKGLDLPAKNPYNEEGKKDEAPPVEKSSNDLIQELRDSKRESELGEEFINQFHKV